MNNMDQNNTQNINNEGISLVELFSVLKKNIIFILVVTVIFTICGGIYGKLVKKPVYSATATAIIQVDDQKTTEYNSFVYAQYLVNSVSEFIVSDSVTKEVAKVLVDEQYGITHTKEENVVKHFSSVQNEEISDVDYDKMITSKSLAIKSGTSISSKDESLIINITYRKEEVDETTPDEVVKTVQLLMEKTQEVALTLKNQTPTRKFPTAESEKAIIYAYEKKYGMDIIHDDKGLISEIIGNTTAYTEAQIIQMIKVDAINFRNNFLLTYDGDSFVLSIKTTGESQKIDDEIANYSLIYLNRYAVNNPVENYVEEYMYPNFANKLQEMGNQPSFANKSTKTMAITLIGLILGLAVSCGLVLVTYLLDDTFKSRTQLEELTGTSVLTSIPKFNVKEEE